VDALTLLGTALTIITSLVGGGVWLMKYNAKLAGQTMKAKKELYDERVQNLKATISGLEQRLYTHEKNLEATTHKLVAATATIERTEKQMVSYVASTEKKIASFESVIVRLSDDLMIIKSKPKGST